MFLWGLELLPSQYLWGQQPTTSAKAEVIYSHLLVLGRAQVLCKPSDPFFFSKFIIHLKNKKSLRLSIPLPRTVRLVGVGSWGVPVGGVYVMFGWGLPSAGRRLSVGVFWEKLNEGPIFKLCSQQKVDNLDGVTSPNGTIIFEKYYTISLKAKQTLYYLIVWIRFTNYTHGAMIFI